MTTPNAELAYKVLDHIDAHPAQHDQDVWARKDSDCGTIACFAGWTCILSGARPVYEPDDDTCLVTIIGDGTVRDRMIPVYAAELLGLSVEVADDLFFTSTLDGVREKVAEIFGPRPAGDAS